MLDVSGGLIEDEPLVDPLLDYEKAAVALGNGGNGDFGLCGGHGGIIAKRSPGAGLGSSGGAAPKNNYPRRATRSPWSTALAFQTVSNSCRYSLATGGLLTSAMPSQVSARIRYMIARSSAIR